MCQWTDETLGRVSHMWLTLAEKGREPCRCKVPPSGWSETFTSIFVMPKNKNQVTFCWVCMNPNVKARLLYTTAVNLRLATWINITNAKHKRAYVWRAALLTRSLRRFCTIAAIGASMCGINTVFEEKKNLFFCPRESSLNWIEVFSSTVRRAPSILYR